MFYVTFANLEKMRKKVYALHKSVSKGKSTKDLKYGCNYSIQWVICIHSSESHKILNVIDGNGKWLMNQQEPHVNSIKGLNQVRKYMCIL